MPRISHTNLVVPPLVLGGNVFGWSADRAESFTVLDAYADWAESLPDTEYGPVRGMVDSADVYSEWVPGHTGGESESIVGEWLATRGRDRLLVATKVAMLTTRPGLSADNIRAAVEDSVDRLGVDQIDLYYAHKDDPAVAVAEVMGTFTELVEKGLVRYVAASQYSPQRLTEALRVSAEYGLSPYVALQANYNLMDRASYEGPLRDAVAGAGISCLTFFSLARGFLTGKYRSGTAVESVRAGGVTAFVDGEHAARGARVLSALDSISAEQGVPQAAVALAWLAVQPTVTAVLASARTVTQLRDLIAMTRVDLGGGVAEALTEASA